MMRNFAGIEEKYADYEKAAIVLQSIPYDGTSTWGKGADKGFSAFLEAAENMELYDIETESEAFKKGIYILPPIKENRDPVSVFKEVYQRTQKLIETDKFLTFFGGEHSISIGIMEAFIEHHPDITILHFDAHADLREEYLGERYNHACALHQAAAKADVVHVGIRSMDAEETMYLNRSKCFFAHEIYNNSNWMTKALNLLNEKVYITFDLDVFDPSIMPSTGTPEPGGLGWYETLKFLKMVFDKKNVMGFDIVELAPIKKLKAPNFLVAKLYYKMLSYKFYNSIIE